VKIRRAASALLVALAAAGFPAHAQGADALSPPPGVDLRLELQGITFHVTSPNAASGNTVRIVPAGLANDDTPIEQAADGFVTGAEVGDLDADGSPEIYIYVRSADDSARGSLIAYAANRKKSLSAISLGDLAGIPGAGDGYAGHDEFAVLEGVLGRRFPIHEHAKPTGRMRQLQYELKPGEAGWLLVFERMTEF